MPKEYLNFKKGHLVYASLDCFEKSSKEEFESQFEKNNLLEQAKKLYPIGTIFYPAHVHNEKHYCIITNDTVFEQFNNEIIAKIPQGDWDNTNNSKYGNTHFNRVIYHNKKWAKIKNQESIVYPVQDVEQVWQKAMLDFKTKKEDTIIYNPVLETECFKKSLKFFHIKKEERIIQKPIKINFHKTKLIKIKN